MISFDNGISKQRSHGERLMPNSKRSMAKKKSATGAMAVIGNEIDADHLNRLEQEFSMKFGEQFAMELSKKPAVHEMDDQLQLEAGEEQDLDAAVLGVLEAASDEKNRLE